MDSNYTLRVAQTVDADAIHELLCRARDRSFLPETFVNKEYRDWIALQCTAKQAWVTKINNEIVAAMVMRDEEIFYIVVAEAHQRKGIGRALIEQAKSKYNYVVGRAKSPQDPIINLLEAEGFQRKDVGGWSHFSYEKQK